MSEHHPGSPETSHEHLSGHEAPEHHKAEKLVDLEAAQVKQHEQLEMAKEVVETETVSKDKTLDQLNDQPAETQPANRPPINRELKNITLKRELKHVRRDLNKPDQLASKVIHQPAVRVVSEVSAKTISRPSGLLGGGITAFIGSGLYYYFTKHIGVRYNYLVFVILFVIGFGLGLLVEVLIWVLRTRNKATD